ncbi:hypothetical protein BT67DRAFT_198988 [Trichocladium antarcticum]|uniref:Uncharacterized protein n=1 Tax=Trichocladium antarcticum TaxID=1450529 RepID=A0AAN6ZGH6_9PEZI|nr:hypothetical protein BT67DRAFT_198988 [Trichocladium antarcticum]
MSRPTTPILWRSGISVSGRHLDALASWLLTFFCFCVMCFWAAVRLASVKQLGEKRGMPRADVGGSYTRELYGDPGRKGMT